MVICSDGVWDQVEPHEVAQILLSSNENCQSEGQSLQENVMKVHELAETRWIEEGEDYVDDITVLAYDVSFGSQALGGKEVIVNNQYIYLK